MMLELSLDSNLDEDGGYTAAMASLSLGSASSVHGASPVAPRRKGLPSPGSRRGKALEASPSPSSSLDELIDKFRASASSLSMSTRGKGDVQSSTPLRRKPSPRKHATRAPSRSLYANVLSGSGTRDTDVAGVSPMPKLTHIPKPKPTLQITAPSKTNTSRLKTPTRVDQRYKSAAKAAIHSSSSSSISENIEPPDSDTAEESLDDLISHDLRKFNRLVSSSRDGIDLLREKQVSKSIDEISDSLQQQTRFRRDSPARSEATCDRRSSFRLFSPSTSPDAFDFCAEMRTLDKKAEDASFADELRAMKRALAQDKKMKKAEEAEEQKKKKDEGIKAAQAEPGANIASLKDAVDTIDKDLLLALRPFEKIKQDIATEEAKVTETKEKEDQALELPMATQAIVERLEQAFGGLTRQREAELKELEGAVAAAKAAEDLKKKEEEDKKLTEEAARRQEELNILRLVPMQGRLLNSEIDVENTLVDLDIAEELARETSMKPNSHLIGAQLDALCEMALRRTQEIEKTLGGCSVSPFCRRAINWHRSTFHIGGQDIIEDEPSVPQDNQDNERSASFGDIVQSEVVEKLDFTILKLKHALAIDKKELEEAEKERQRAAEVSAAEARKREEERKKQEEIDANAAAARQRVMGVSSMQEIEWVAATEASLRHDNYDEAAARRLEEQFKDVQSQGFARGLPSFFESTRAAERFDSVKLMMEAPYLHHILPGNQSLPSSRAKPGDQIPSPLQTIRPFAERSFADNQAQPTEDERDDVPSRYNTGIARNPRAFQQFTESSRYSYLRDNLNPTHQHQVHQLKAGHTMTKSKSCSRPMGQKLEEMMESFHQFQRYRRDKAMWFYSSQRFV